MPLLALMVFALLAGVAQAAIPPEKSEEIRALFRARKVVEAEAAAKALVAANPNEAEAYALLGAACENRDDPDGAVKACEKAVQLAPASGEYQFQLGDAYGFAAQKAGMLSKVGWAKKCLAAYEKGVALEPKNINGRTRLMTFYQQAPGIVGGGMDKAYAQAEEIKKLDPLRGHMAYVTLYINDKKYAEAYADLEEILKATPDYYPALYQFGRLAVLTGDRVDRGLEMLKQSLALTVPLGSPGHDAAQWRIGNLWEKKGDKQSARAAYEAALAINPRFQQAIDALKKLE